MLISLEKRKFIIGHFKQVVETILDQLQKNTDSKVILPCSLHDLAIQNNRINQSFYQEVDFCTSDSMLLTNYLRHKYHKQIERVYGPELMLAILKQKQATSSKDKHYFLAANKKSMLALKKIHQKKYSNVPAVFDFLPYNINQQTETEYLKKIVVTKPQFIWLGIGSPKQVQLASWLKKHQTKALIICAAGMSSSMMAKKNN